jgi:hypothetical protein
MAWGEGEPVKLRYAVSTATKAVATGNHGEPVKLRTGSANIAGSEKRRPSIESSLLQASQGL